MSTSRVWCWCYDLSGRHCQKDILLLRNIMEDNIGIFHNWKLSIKHSFHFTVIFERTPCILIPLSSIVLCISLMCITKCRLFLHCQIRLGMSLLCMHWSPYNHALLIHFTFKKAAFPFCNVPQDVLGTLSLSDSQHPNRLFRVYTKQKINVFKME